MADYYDPDGQPITLEEWGDLFEKRKRSNYDGSWWKRETVVQVDGKRICISTVWLGLDHSFTGNPPLIWESMIFADDDDDDIIQRYPTRKEAWAGHDDLVRRYAEGRQQIILG